MSRSAARFFARWFESDSSMEESDTTRLMDGSLRPKGPEDVRTVSMERPVATHAEANTALDIPADRPFMVDPTTDETVLRLEGVPSSIPTPNVRPPDPAGYRKVKKRRRWTAWHIIPLGIALGLFAGGVSSAIILGLLRFIIP